MHADIFSGVNTSWERLAQNSLPNFSPHTSIWMSPRYHAKAPVSHGLITLFLIIHSKCKEHIYTCLMEWQIQPQQGVNARPRPANKTVFSRELSRQKLKWWLRSVLWEAKVKANPQAEATNYPSQTAKLLPKIPQQKTLTQKKNPPVQAERTILHQNWPNPAESCTQWFETLHLTAETSELIFLPIKFWL